MLPGERGAQPPNPIFDRGVQDPVENSARVCPPHNEQAPTSLFMEIPTCPLKPRQLKGLFNLEFGEVVLLSDLRGHSWRDADDCDVRRDTLLSRVRSF